MAAVQLERVVKRYDAKVTVIHGVDLQIKHGEFVVFVGPSGCGKSTLLRMVAGLEPISGGSISIDGQVVNDLPPRHRDIAMVFQDYALYPHKTLFDNMAFGLRLRKTGEDEIKRRVMDAARLLHIDHLLGRRPAALSGGQRQRVAIGRAIVRKPKVFLFDEPLSNLDAALRVNMRIELSRLHKDLGTTMIYVTHDQVEAMTLGDRIAVFNQGIVEQIGAPMALYKRPANQFVATFIGAPRINLVDRPGAGAPAAHQALWAALLGPASAAAPAATRRVGLRPEHLQLVAAGQGVPARVVLAEHLGDSSILHLQVDGVRDLLNAKVGTEYSSIDSGQLTGLQADPTWTLSFDDAGRLLP